MGADRGAVGKPIRGTENQVEANLQPALPGGAIKADTLRRTRAA